jgi:hypothetical protein
MIPTKVRHNAWPFLLPLYLAASNPDKTMSQIHGKSRDQAEIVFGNAQSQALARNRAVDELASLVRFREEKTLRLREARLAKESRDRATATASLLAKRARTT